MDRYEYPLGKTFVVMALRSQLPLFDFDTVEEASAYARKHEPFLGAFVVVDRDDPSIWWSNRQERPARFSVV